MCRRHIYSRTHFPHQNTEPYSQTSCVQFRLYVFTIQCLFIGDNDQSFWLRPCQSINQSIHLYRAIIKRRVLRCDYAESKKNVLRRILNVLTDGAVRQFSGREFQSLEAATEKRRAAVSKLCGGTDRNFCVDDHSKRDWLYGLIKSAR